MTVNYTWSCWQYAWPSHSPWNHGTFSFAELPAVIPVAMLKLCSIDSKVFRRALRYNGGNDSGDVVSFINSCPDSLSPCNWWHIWLIQVQFNAVHILHAHPDSYTHRHFRVWWRRFAWMPKSLLALLWWLFIIIITSTITFIRWRDHICVSGAIGWNMIVGTSSFVRLYGALPLACYCSVDFCCSCPKWSLHHQENITGFLEISSLF